MSTSEEFQDAQKDFYKKRYEFLRYILLIESGTLSVLISFHKVNEVNTVSHYLFITSLMLIGFGILTGGAALYGEVHIASLLSLHHAKNIVRQMKGEKNSPTALLKMPRILIWCERICYIVLMLSVVSLISYVVVN